MFNCVSYKSIRFDAKKAVSVLRPLLIMLFCLTLILSQSCSLLPHSNTGTETGNEEPLNQGENTDNTAGEEAHEQKGVESSDGKEESSQLNERESDWWYVPGDENAPRLSEFSKEEIIGAIERRDETRVRCDLFGEEPYYACPFFLRIANDAGKTLYPVCRSCEFDIIYIYTDSRFEVANSIIFNGKIYFNLRCDKVKDTAVYDMETREYSFLVDDCSPSERLEMYSEINKRPYILDEARGEVTRPAHVISHIGPFSPDFSRAVICSTSESDEKTVRFGIIDLESRNIFWLKPELSFKNASTTDSPQEFFWADENTLYAYLFERKFGAPSVISDIKATFSGKEWEQDCITIIDIDNKKFSDAHNARIYQAVSEYTKDEN